MKKTYKKTLKHKKYLDWNKQGSYMHSTRTENKPSSISTFRLVISETFLRKKGVWLKTTTPTTVEWWVIVRIEHYGSKG
jgi:hypothetical protein